MATDYVDQVAGAIIQQLKEGTAPWQKPWEAGERFMPYNPTTGNDYHGMNAIWLMSQCQNRGFADARWLTYRQSQEQNAQVRKGEKGTPIQFWKWQGLEPVRDAEGRPVLDPEGQPVRQMVRYERPRVLGAVVFNAEQIDGLPPAPLRPVLPEWERHAQAETILQNSGVPILHVPGDRAFYRPSDDRITMPERGQFPTGDRYYATALHELGHATGHSSRLNRDLAHPFGSEGYAREELRAEIGSLMLGEQLGIGHDPGQHVAYVASWIKVLQQDPREVFRAAADAEKITTLVRSYEQVQQQTADQTQQAVQVQVANDALEAEVESNSPPMVGGTLPWRQSGRDAAAEPVSPGNTDTGITGQGSTENVSSQPSALQSVRMPTLIREDSPAMKLPSPERTYLAVPYAEKDAAKQLGAKWDRTEKSWYVPAGGELDAFAAWMPAKGSVHIVVEVSPVEQFAEAIRECGLQLKGAPQMDGRIHRVPVEGEKGGKRSGAYSGHLDGRPAGFIQNHKTGVKQNWKAAGRPEALSAKDRAQMAAEAAQKRQDRAQEREQQAERVAQQVDALWTAAAPVHSHPYLTGKGVQAHGLRQDADGELLVPVQDADGRIWSLQRIGNDGFKLFQEGGKVEGGHFVIGDVKQAGPLLIAEGFATAATLHEMTDMPVITAFNAGNLLPVAQTYRGLYPGLPIYIAGDDDWQRALENDAQGRPKVNVGRVKAEEAAAAIGGQAIFPSFPPDSPGTDWNDLAQLHGRLNANVMVRQAIAIADREQAAQHLTAAREAAEQESELEETQTDQQSRSTLGKVLGRIGKALGRGHDRASVDELEQGYGR